MIGEDILNVMGEIKINSNKKDLWTTNSVVENETERRKKRQRKKRQQKTKHYKQIAKEMVIING